MTALHDRPLTDEIPPSAHGAEHLIDLSRVALEPPAESIAHENEVVEHIAHEHDYPEQPSRHPIEEQLQGARRYYNATVRDLNTSIQSFPNVTIARPMGFTEAEFYQDDDASIQTAPVVKFGAGA